MEHYSKIDAVNYEGRDIVVISIQPWYYELGSNCKNIAKEFSKKNRVLYINIPITRKTFYSKKNSQGVSRHIRIIKEKSDPLELIEENLWQYYPVNLIESINWLPSKFLFRNLNYINNRRFAQDIKQAISRLGFRDIILFNDNDIYNGFHLKELLQPKLYVYYMRDFLQGYAFWKKFSEILEPLLLAKADVVVANSEYYADYSRSYNPRSHYVGQGCNLEIFLNTSDPAPKDLAEIKRPIIGYIGALDSARLSLDVIRHIAISKPEWSIVLVGPEDANFIASDLHGLENIYFLGRRNILELPGFIQAFDVCINPQSMNIITNGNYPLKIDEYLAMGKQVVATQTKAMELFRDYTYQAKDKTEYPALIEKAINDEKDIDKERLINFARSHTWENSINQIYKAFMIAED